MEILSSQVLQSFEEIENVQHKVAVLDIFLTFMTLEKPNKIFTLFFHNWLGIYTKKRYPY